MYNDSGYTLSKPIARVIFEKLPYSLVRALEQDEPGMFIFLSKWNIILAAEGISGAPILSVAQEFGQSAAVHGRSLRPVCETIVLPLCCC